MTTLTLPARRTDDIADEIDTARRRGSLQQIVVPPCPALLARLQQAVEAREPDLNEVARIAQSDVAMAATLLRNANSPAYGGGQPVQTVGQAMTRLGLRQTAALMTAFLVRHALPVKHRSLGSFWEHSGRRAVAMGWIAAQLPGMSPDQAYTFGLFCHVGQPVLLQSVRGYGSTLVEAAARTDRSFLETENANHRTDHAVVGALVARVWRLAPEVMAAIRLHHELLALGEGATQPEVHSLVAAGVLAEHLVRQHEGLGDDADWQRDGAAAMAWLQVSADDLRHWTGEISAALDDA